MVVDVTVAGCVLLLWFFWTLGASESRGVESKMKLEGIMFSSVTESKVSLRECPGVVWNPILSYGANLLVFYQTNQGERGEVMGFFGWRWLQVESCLREKVKNQESNVVFREGESALEIEGVV